MKWKKLINWLGPAMFVATAVVLLAARPAPRSAFAACEFSVGPNHATCCECANEPDKGDPCRPVENNGVASCTFELCSQTRCTIGPS